MLLGEVLKKEREKKGLALAEVAEALGVSEEDYQEMEAGESPIETWGPHLAQIAIQLETPTSRLIAESGRSEDAEAGQVGRRIGEKREERDKTEEEMAEALGIEADDYAAIEAGKSPLEEYAPRLLAFAEVIEQPVFNLFYPCGLPFQELDDYP